MKAPRQRPAYPGHGPSGRKSPFSPSEVTAIRAHLAAAGTPRDRSLFEVGISTCLRSGDLLALTTGAVLDDAGNVVETLPVKMQKTSGRACRSVTVRLSANARTAIAELIQVEGKLPADNLFTRPGCPHGAPLCRMQLRRLIKGWASAVGLDPDRVAGHSLRRTLPVHVYTQSKDVEACRIALGHTSLVHTSAYLGVTQAQALAVMAAHEM